ncbi:MAG TPA: hypothetical protein PLH57_01160, partial [Oligoflexia bacterium]|nr:hypothetical protein [Oligoflexia bacterium]
MKKNQLQYSTVIGVATRLKHCFEALDVKMPDLEIERLSHFINIVYGTRNRAFHDVGHALGVGTGCTAIGQLAALFHDVVYLQVDRSRLNELRSLFGVFDPGDSLELTIPAQETLERDPWRHALVTLFGFKAGQKLGPFTGVNEFLSGWVAVQKLKNLVEAKELIQILACIEATIPFRGEQDAPSASEKLLANLRAASDLLAVNLNVTELEESIGEAVRVSNNDVMGFGLQEPEVFIYNSWALLYEGNPALQNDYYTLIKYREPLLRLESFLGSLNPRKIFLTYKNI